MTQVFDEFHEDHDLMTLLTMVNKKVAAYESNSSRVDYTSKKQTPFIYSTLMYKLYLEAK